jgi:hypothetical protein
LLGKHAYPGRFFAVNELKIIMAHMVTRYDIRFGDAVRPTNLNIGFNCIPNARAKVLLRSRDV